MIFITGDKHSIFGGIKQFCKDYNTSKEDTLIILGDVGINFFRDVRDRMAKDMLSGLNIKLFCIKGNHDLYPKGVQGYTEINYHGGKAFIEYNYPNLIFAKDGEIYDFDGKKCIIIGGAYSVDKYYRLERGWKWFEDEQPSEETKKYVEEQLDKVNWKVDVVMTHTCPEKYEPREWFLDITEQSKVDRNTEKWLDTVEDRLVYEKWYCGHFHGNKVIDKMRFMFQDIIEFR